MTTKEYSDLMRQIGRQLGYIEGMAIAVDGDLGSTLTDGLLVLGEMLEKLEEEGA